MTVDIDKYPTTSLPDDGPNSAPDRKAGWLAAGGILGAVGATSCCVLPLALTLLGVSGAWMANLRALAPFQPYFIALAVAAMGYGFYRVYRPRVACTEGDACAKPLPNTVVKTGLWTGATIVAIAASFPAWFPIILPYLP
jgi:mercuric ion transport protein